jgi:hypothetical protein
MTPCYGCRNGGVLGGGSQARGLGSTREDSVLHPVVASGRDGMNEAGMGEAQYVQARKGQDEWTHSEVTCLIQRR